MTASESGTGVVLRDPLPWEEAVEIVQTAETAGYDAVFVPEIDAREAFSTLAGFAGATERMRVGTGVVTIWSRSPRITAMAAATVHDLSGGRMILGIGSGSPPPQPEGAPPRPGPLAMVGDYVEAVHRGLAGREVRAEALGERGFRLGLELGERPPPVWLAALGDRMLALAGRVADGVILNWCTPDRVAAARRIVAEAAERAGRDPGTVTISVYVRACLGQQEEWALAALRHMTGMYASFPAYLHQMELMGLGDPARAAAAAFRGGRPADVPEALVRTLTVTGGRAEVVERFAAYREAGADLVLCYPVADARDRFSTILGTVLAAAPSPALER